MNEARIRAKIELYHQLLQADPKYLSDLEISLMSLLASDVHIQMQIDGKLNL